MSGASLSSGHEPRWLVRRRAEAAAALVRSEVAEPDQACSLYGVSVAQFEGWRRAGELVAARNARFLRRLGLRSSRSA